MASYYTISKITLTTGEVKPGTLISDTDPRYTPMVNAGATLRISTDAIVAAAAAALPKGGSLSDMEERMVAAYAASNAAAIVVNTAAIAAGAYTDARTFTQCGFLSACH